MGYYVRVLGLRDEHIPLTEIAFALDSSGVSAKLEVDAGDPDTWSEVVIKLESGEEIALLERNEVRKGELGQEEIDEFVDAVRDERPRSAANWLAAYLPRVRVIFAFQILDSIDQGDGWKILGVIQTAIWNRCGGILQADAEGFSNEDGYHILWQFNDNVSGKWVMAVLNPAGVWSRFEMDLGDPAQREAFWAGEIPERARPL